MTDKASNFGRSKRITVFSCYGEAWRGLRRQFLELLLVVAVVFAFMLVTGSPYYSVEDWSHVAVGDGRYIFAILYIFLVLRPMEYGSDYVFLRAARGQSPDVRNLFEVFQNYVNVVLGTILVGTIIGLGMPILIIPGIIFACKLAFVPYLIVDDKLDVLTAVRRSWNMTSGYTWRIFGVGLLAVFVYLLGLLVFGVGIIVSIIWVKLTFAVIYHRVRSAEEVGYETKTRERNRTADDKPDEDKGQGNGLENMLDR